MMKKTILIAVSLLSCTVLSAQLSDDFSDGDFTSNPEWIGQTEKFTIVDNALQLLDDNAGASNEAYLYTAAVTSNDAPTTWEFWVKMDFNPSNDNYTKVYLNASSPNLIGDVNGYYIRMGRSGSNDAIELLRQDGSSSEVLLSGTPGAIASDPIVRVRVSRSITGEWNVQADYTGGTAYQDEGSVTDLTYPTGGFFGFVCTYSVSRNDAFTFDDILVDPLFEDTEPPMLLSANAESATEIILMFNELLDPVSAETPANYSISEGVGSPTSATIELSNPTNVRLSLSSPLISTINYTITCNNIADELGNIAPPLSAEFSFIDIQAASPQDIIIVEIMFDPSPVVEQPNGEYIELYNRSDKIIDLSTLSFSSGSSPKQLPSYLLFPDTYAAIVDEDVFSEYPELPSILSLISFPGLTNSRDTLVITNDEGELITKQAYELSWLRDVDSFEGGYSLELIDLSGPYDCPGNWRASQSFSGGTPAAPNSWLGSVPDDEAPIVKSAVAETAFEITVRFSERMDESSILTPEYYSLDNGRSIEEVILQDDNAVMLLSSEPLETGLKYELQLNEAITDCMGNALMDNSFFLGVAEQIEAGDIIINELLFNPEPNGFDYLELYNRSAKALNLDRLIIRNSTKETGNIQEILDQDYLLFPEEYVVITDSPDDIRNRYFTQNPQAFVDNDLPTFGDDGGNVTLRLDGITIDSFDYVDDLHYALLNSEEGVSLERLSPNTPTNDNGNWHSAASTVGFGTPTYKNSQFIPISSQLDEMINLVNTTFSPNEDGFEDVLLIQYQTDEPGYSLNLYIFDSNGRPVRRLVNNEILASSGSFQWDGTTDDLEKARIGIYVLWFELFLPDGRVEKDKKVCVLAEQLD
jgi:hypothetical protein